MEIQQYHTEILPYDIQLNMMGDIIPLSIPCETDILDKLTSTGSLQSGLSYEFSRNAQVMKLDNFSHLKLASAFNIVDATVVHFNRQSAFGPVRENVKNPYRETFNIFMFIGDEISSYNFNFYLDDKKHHIKPGKFYYVNTRKLLRISTFDIESKMVIFRVDVNSIKDIFDNLQFAVAN